jgi:hypothetical protein
MKFYMGTTKLRTVPADWVLILNGDPWQDKMRVGLMEVIFDINQTGSCAAAGQVHDMEIQAHDIWI